MKNLGKAAMTGLQVVTAVSSIAPTTPPAYQEVATKLTQTDLNQKSLKSIEESWLQVPRACKAAGFNAQPTALAIENRPAAISTLYSNFIA